MNFTVGIVFVILFFVYRMIRFRKKESNVEIINHYQDLGFQDLDSTNRKYKSSFFNETISLSNNEKPFNFMIVFKENVIQGFYVNDFQLDDSKLKPFILHFETLIKEKEEYFIKYNYKVDFKKNINMYFNVTHLSNNPFLGKISS